MIQLLFKTLVIIISCTITVLCHLFKYEVRKSGSVLLICTHMSESSADFPVFSCEGLGKLFLVFINFLTKPNLEIPNFLFNISNLLHGFTFNSVIF